MDLCGCGDTTEREAAGELLAPPTQTQPDEADAPEFSLTGDVPTFAPDRPADVRHIDINVTLDFADERVDGDVTNWFGALFDDLTEVTLDAAEMHIERVSTGEGDNELRWWIEGEKLHVRLDRTYQHDETFGIRVRYSAHPRTGLVFVKPTEGDPNLPTMAWTQGETEYHHYWFPCHDFPNDRATTKLRATVPGTMFVVSNGVLDGVEEHSDGRKTYSWRMDVPFPAYLVTLVAGRLVELPNSWHNVPVNGYVRPGREADGRELFAKTPAMMEYYSQHFGVDYPYPKYAETVAELFTGAMENASATTHTYRMLADERARLDYSGHSTVAHELVHQWFGDLIAIRDWSQTWLKESFATYFQATWKQHDLGEDEFQVDMRDKLHSYLEADKRGRRPIVYNVYRKNGQELYDRHNYEKGARVLHMLRHVVGDQAFWRGMQHYTRRNQGREVITADFERAMEEATGHSLARFFEQWVYKAGYPRFKVSYSWDDERNLAKVTVKQTQKVTGQTPLFVTPVDLGFLLAPEGASEHQDEGVPELVVFRVTVDAAEQSFYLPLARRPRSVRFDQGGWLLATVDFERPTAMLRYQLRHDPDVLGRIEAAEALAKKADRDSFEALTQALANDSFWAVRKAVARALGEQKTERALDALLAALPREEHPKARRGVVEALGEFAAPAQPDLAKRAADALAHIVEQGDASYYVEAAAATALGKTRTPGAIDRILPMLSRDSWLQILRAGALVGIGETGDPRAVGILAEWATDRTKPMDARAGAVSGLRALAATKRIEGEAKTRAVEAVGVALSDPWEMVVYPAIAAARAWDDTKLIPTLERVAATDPSERAVRMSREAILALKKGGTRTREERQLHGDVEKLQQENRQLRERLAAIEAMLKPETAHATSHGDGHGNGAHATATENGATHDTMNGAAPKKGGRKNAKGEKE